MNPPADVHAILFPGDPRHELHGGWLLELGRTTYIASRVAGICFDVLRVRADARSRDLYRDPLGDLQKKLGLFVEEQGSALADGDTFPHLLP